MNFKNNPHASYSIYGAVILELLKVWLPPGHEDQISATQKILTWYGILAATTTGNLPPPSTDPQTTETMTQKKSIIPILALAIVAFLFTGCVSSIKAVGDSKAIVSVTSTTLGLRVAQATQNQTPELDFGYTRQTVVLMPASTNGPIFAPSYANTFNFDQTHAFSFGLGETVASGNYQTLQPTADSTNTMTSQPILAK